MAIDNAEKRKSIGGLPFLIPGVTPNAAKDAQWRTESGWGYSGMIPDPPIGGVGIAVVALGTLFPFSVGAPKIGPVLNIL